MLRSDDGGERRYDLNDPADLQGATLDGDDLFEGGESVNVSHSLSGRVRILLVETSDGGAVLYDEYKTLTGDGVTPTPTPTATSTPNATATSTATATDTPTSTPTATSTTTTAPTAAPTNQPPTAEFAYNRKGNSENVDLDASPSTDSDGTIVQYQWDYGNDETIDATGQTLSQVKIASGTPVRLIVTDDDGATDEVVKTV
ncbi:MAG: PKD domain-containing protein [Halobellus sp.]